MIKSVITKLNENADTAEQIATDIVNGYVGVVNASMKFCLAIIKGATPVVRAIPKLRIELHTWYNGLPAVQKQRELDEAGIAAALELQSALREAGLMKSAPEDEDDSCDQVDSSRGSRAEPAQQPS